MVIQDLLDKKRLKKELTDNEISFFINGVAKDEFKDYEVSAMLMAIAINGMTDRETTTLTLEMAKTGEMVDLSKIDGVKADKHSTGGISDTTTLAVVPILASLGVKMAKMSGRSLGFTGGTVDKLEAIDGYKTDISKDDFIKNLQTIGASVISQTDNIAVADKKLYAMRDVTSTVQSIPLIASSIMSKKLASGADIILLDVKFGKGAFMKTKKDATKLSKLMVTIGKNAGKKMCAIISSMEEPLGKGIGCTMEVRDAVQVLNGAKNPLATVSKCICVEILKLAKNIDNKTATTLVEKAISDKSALNKFAEMVKAQGGNEKIIFDLSLLKQSKSKVDVKAKTQGTVCEINGEMLGNSCKLLGGGRFKKTDPVLHEVGIDMEVRIGTKVNVGDTLCTIYYNDDKNVEEVKNSILNAIKIKNVKHVKKPKLIYKIVR